MLRFLLMGAGLLAFCGYLYAEEDDDNRTPDPAPTETDSDSAPDRKPAVALLQIPR